jgi:hypothetical protein
VNLSRPRDQIATRATDEFARLRAAVVIGLGQHHGEDAR